jgi:hypothetical protein
MRAGHYFGAAFPNIRVHDFGITRIEKVKRIVPAAAATGRNRFQSTGLCGLWGKN